MTNIGEGILTKFCTDCGEEKSIDNYHKNKGGKYGVHSRCKQCSKVRKKAYNESNRDKIKAYNSNQYAENKEAIREGQKRYYEEHKEEIKANVRKWEIENSERKAERNTLYRKEKPELHQARQKRYVTNNRERVRELGVKNSQIRRARMRKLDYNLTETEWLDTLEHFEHSCAYCGKTDCKLEQEHIVPVTNGGAYTKSNITPSCKSCNVSKHNNELIRWYEKQESFTVERLQKIVGFSNYPVEEVARQYVTKDGNSKKQYKKVSKKALQK